MRNGHPTLSKWVQALTIDANAVDRKHSHFAMDPIRGRSSCRWRFTLPGCGTTLWVRRNFTGLHIWDNRRTAPQDAQEGQTSHPPSPGGYFTHPPLSLPGQPLRPGARLVPSKAATSEEARRVDLVHLVCLVHLVGLVQPNKRDKPNKPNNSLLTLADFFSIQLASASDSVALQGVSPRSTQTGGVQSKGMRCLRSMEEASGDATAS